jgi:cell division protein FtsZ
MNEIVSKNSDGKLNSAIKIIGVGEIGNQIAARLSQSGMKDIDFIICDKSTQPMDHISAPNKIRLGYGEYEVIKGHLDEIGWQMLLVSFDKIKEALSQNTKIVFIIAGLGGITGSGVAPVIAREAKKMGILSIAFVTLPYKKEREKINNTAIEGLQNFKDSVDSLMIFNNQNLYKIYTKISDFDYYPTIIEIIPDTIKGIIDMINKQGYINIELADIKAAFTNSGVGVIGVGKSIGKNRIKRVIGQVFKMACSDKLNIPGAKTILMIVRSDNKNPLKDSELNTLKEGININNIPTFFTGALMEESLDDDLSFLDISVTIIATGFSLEKAIPRQRFYD